jgi:hypothetical protein
MDYKEIGLIHLAGGSEQWRSYGQGNKYSGPEKGNFPIKILCAFLVLLVRTTYSDHLIFRDLIILTTFGEEQTL